MMTSVPGRSRQSLASSPLGRPSGACSGWKASPHCRCAGPLAGIWILGLVLVACGPTQNLPTPEQPIAYDHQVHIEAGLECVRCHRGAEEGVHAGMPSVQSCAGCHRREIPDHPEVQKAMLANENREPILWAKVNVIPDSAMVHFNHRAHARAGIECLTCHGDVASMTVAEPVRNVADMGWCVECHRENEASDDCLACHR
ncbi:MAG: cytochrome c3 family protein [Holophagales bacterium]|nr:cytochrome c3 family protein [Holophagales bacterium]